MMKMNKIPFEIIGHILILNPRNKISEEKLLRFGEYKLRKHPNIETICLKKEKVQGTKRVPEIIYLLGKKQLETVHKEYGNSYVLNPAQVFFSPRLSYERQRIANLASENEIIINFFAGVGPFSISIAKIVPSTIIHSIEINNIAYDYLLKNIKINNVASSIVPHLGDAFTIVENKLLNKANRILLPLPLESERGLLLALKALKNNSGIIHWEISKYVLSKNNIPFIAELALNKILEKNGIDNNFLIRESRLIRWLAPRIAHIGVDIEFY